MILNYQSNIQCYKNPFFLKISHVCKMISCLWNTQSGTNHVIVKASEIIFFSILTIICMVLCILLLRVQERLSVLCGTLGAADSRGSSVTNHLSTRHFFVKQKGHCSDSYWDMAKIWNRNIWGRLPDPVNSSNVFSLSYTSFISWDGTTQIA